MRWMQQVKTMGAIGVWLALVSGCDPQDGAAGAAESAPARALGEACETSKDCAEDQYCTVAEGECGRLGTCELRPLACERDRPVCGCDGVTYEGGACEAAMSGENVDFQGECPPPPCLSNTDCAADQYCAKVTGDCGGYGACTPRPLMCSAAVSKVCGCNGVTYDNACKAAKQGVTVQKTGKC